LPRSISSATCAQAPTARASCPSGQPSSKATRADTYSPSDSLLIDAVEVLNGEHLAATRGGKWSAGQGYFGRYFWLVGLESLLHANFARWGTLADTPLWLRIWPGLDPRVTDALEPLRTTQPRRLFDDDGELQISVPLPSDGDCEACLASIVATLKEVQGLLAPLESSSAAKNQRLTEFPGQPE
jgi:hypothetical protein